MSGGKQVVISTLTQSRLQDEETRRAERNRAVFEAWLEKKREERKKERALKMEALRREEEAWERERIRGIGQKAFERWLKMKQAEDKLMKKQLSRERELERLKREEVRERLHRSEVAFNTWKHLKDAEFKTERELARHQQRSVTTPMTREPTPSLPGYCSVWSCDEDMAQHFVTRVRRSRSLELSDYRTQFTESDKTHFPSSHPHNLAPPPPTHTHVVSCKNHQL
ncbi:hypothetical protein GBAR_LOCUS4505 [Geodia barretti]|uniref:Coiled-coil domain-containing protein 34 n=1 Tax=Geodia barretti TaxID=519541 RepID=A0AA35R8S7_GEOBA|nr:hypothetical protein GBAR_LOCUS4505 [Geodia barretti]